MQFEITFVAFFLGFTAGHPSGDISQLFLLISIWFIVLCLVAIGIPTIVFRLNLNFCQLVRKPLMEVELLSGACGAEIAGIDLRDTSDGQYQYY